MPLTASERAIVDRVQAKIGPTIRFAPARAPAYQAPKVDRRAACQASKDAMAGVANRKTMQRWLVAELKVASLLPRCTLSGARPREDHLTRCIHRLEDNMRLLERPNMPEALQGIDASDISSAIATLAGAIPKGMG